MARHLVRTRLRRLLCGGALAAVTLLGAPDAGAVELLWSNQASSYGEPLRSVEYPGVDSEAADDFDVTGSIERLIVRGRNDCTGGCFDPPQPAGVWVRFYEATASGPGALERETWLPAGDPGFLYDTVSGATSLDLTLPEPFLATGRHFLSIQPVFAEPFNWRHFQANYNAPVDSLAMTRDNAAGGSWQQATDFWGALVSQDLAFSLYGCPADGCTPPPPVAECGEWAEVPSANPDGDARLEDVAVIAPWDVWAVGSYQGPVDGYWDPRQQSLAMHWNGSEWSVVPSPSPAPSPSTTQVSLAAVDGVATDDVWAVGRKRDQDAGGYTGGRVFAVHWDGFAWTDMDAPWPGNVGSIYTGASGEELFDVAAVGADDVWMVGRYWREESSGAITWPGVAMRWNGSDFEVHELPMVSPSLSQYAAAVAAVSSDDVWAVGSGEGVDEPAYIWHWDGSAWSAVTAPTPGADRELLDVVAVSADDVWAAGRWRDASYVWHPMMLHWNGSQWSEVATPAGGRRLAAWATDDILTFGTNGWAHWDGATWSADEGPQIIPAGVIRSLAVDGPCGLWAVGWKSDVRGEMTLTERLSPAAGGGDDLDLDGVPDLADNCPGDYNPDQLDCDLDGAGDVCELTSGSSQDCNGNGTPDDCESFADCNVNEVPDECEADCNDNGAPDQCDVDTGASVDCDLDGIPDECQAFPDCNGNGIDDECDIAGGVSDDANGNGYPDECEALGPEYATVTTPDDVVDFGGAMQVADLPGPDGVVSFREAVLAANNTPGPQTVAFNIPPELWAGLDADVSVELRIEDGLFQVTDDFTTIDFTTQTAFTGDTNPDGGEVTMYGYQANAWGVTAIQIDADDCVVRGMGRVLQRGYGVRISGNRNRVVGSTITGPIHAGVYVTGGFEGPVASDNVIGGTAPGEGNVISGGDAGVRIDAPAADTLVIGNVISGGNSGVSIRAGSSGNRVGGPTPAERNVIAGAGSFSSEGCPGGQQVAVLDSDDNVVEGNYIGLTLDGSASAGQRGTAGILVRGSARTAIRDNVIGGILTVGVNHCSGERYGTAVRVEGLSSQTVVEGNLVGVAADGVTPVPDREGIAVAQWVGGENPTATLLSGNVVANGELDGVRVGPSTTGVTLTANSIRDNGLLGIDLSGTGNGGQAAPDVLSATTDGANVAATGTVTGVAGRLHVVELFASDACDPSGAGEGETFLGAVSVQTDAAGQAAFSTVLHAAVPAGAVLTATSTDTVAGTTSEFSTCAPVAPAASCLAAPGEVSRIDVEMTTISWDSSGTGVTYDVARGSVAGLREGAAATCLDGGLTTTSVDDASMPAGDEGFYYLVRASNDCGDGPWSGSATAVGDVCP